MHQLIFRDAMAWWLGKLVEDHGGGFSQDDRDVIVAALASVVFPESEIDPSTVKRHRERRKQRGCRKETDCQADNSDQ